MGPLSKKRENRYFTTGGRVKPGMEAQVRNSADLQHEYRELFGKPYVQAFAEGGSVSTGIPAGGHAAGPIASYLAGPLSGDYGLSYDPSGGSTPDYKKLAGIETAKRAPGREAVIGAVQTKRAEDKANDNEQALALAALNNPVQAGKEGGTGYTTYGGTKEAAHENIDTAFEEFGDVLNAGIAAGVKSGTPEADAIAAQNPAFNQGLQDAHKDVSIEWTNKNGDRFIKNKSQIVSSDFVNLDPQTANKLAADSLLAAGISNIGGKYNQDDHTNIAQDLYSYNFTGGGDDGVGNWGILGDKLGAIGDALGFTDYAGEAAKTATTTGPLATKSSGTSASQAIANQEVADGIARQKEFDKAKAAQKVIDDAAAAYVAPVTTYTAPRQNKDRDRSNTVSGSHGASSATVAREQNKQEENYLNAMANGGRVVGPLASAYANGGLALASYEDPDEEREKQQQRQLVHAQIRGPQQQKGPLGQIGDQVKGDLLGKAAGFITKALFGGLFNDGGEVQAPAGPAAPPTPEQNAQIQQLIEAVQSGQMTPEEFIQALMQLGVPPEGMQAIIKHVMGNASANTQNFNDGGPVDLVATAVAEKLGNPGGPRLPTQSFDDGGMAMAIPGGGPVSKVKTKKKSTQGHNMSEEEMTLEFDTKAMPPMSDMTMSALNRLN